MSKQIQKQHQEISLKDISKLESQLYRKSENFWILRGEKAALSLFRQMSKRVPAYKDFLVKNNFDPKSVRSINDFSEIPKIDKDNYLRQYPLHEMCWDGNFSNQSWVVSTTSGSTGKPFYFPRTSKQDEMYAITAELYLRENFKIHQRTTLYVDAFAMGAWIGGLFTYEAVRRVALKGYALSIITPGVNKLEVVNGIRNLGDKFDQVIIGCYPPLLKDILDLGEQEGLKWADYNLGIVFSAEGFSEEFRDFIIKKAGLKDKFASTLNHYGTVDLGTMSHETPYSIYARRTATLNPELFIELFGESKMQPTVGQYMPEMFYFEEENGGLVCSSDSGIPLVRYDLKDTGGVLRKSEVDRLLNQDNLKLPSDFYTNSVWNLPFVYIYERSDFSVTLYGGVIYPEEVRRAILKSSYADQISGKFTLEIVQSDNFDSYLVINLELREGTKETKGMAQELQNIIFQQLLDENSEFASNYTSKGDELKPLIKLWEYGSTEFFDGKGKQKWVR